MTVSINGTSGITVGTGSVTFPDASTQNTAATGFGFKNRIINGAMMIDQRNAGASVTPTNSQYLVDRFYAGLTQASKYTAQQSSTAPAGFTKSLLITSSSAYSVGASDVFYIGQGIEGFNIADLGWGAAGAATVTLSFWVRSSLTGTFGGSIFNGSSNRSYPFSYTISAANTFEQKTITIAGDTSGTWATNNTGGMYLAFGLGAGSTYSAAAGAWAAGLYLSATGATSVVGTNGATFYITGVQLEKGSTATSFDYRPYGTELALCQRYYTVLGNEAAANIFISGYITSSGYLSNALVLPVKMRAAPTGTVVGSWTVSNVSTPTLPYISAQTAILYAAGTVIGQGVAYNSSSSAYLTFSAEL